MSFLRAKFFVLTRPLGHVAIQFLELDEPVHIFLTGSHHHTMECEEMPLLEKPYGILWVLV